MVEDGEVLWQMDANGGQHGLPHAWENIFKGWRASLSQNQKIWCKDDMHDELINQQLKLHDLTSDYDKWLSMRKYVNI